MNNLNHILRQSNQFFAIKKYAKSRLKQLNKDADVRMEVIIHILMLNLDSLFRKIRKIK